MKRTMRHRFISAAQLVNDDRVEWFLLKAKCDRLDKARGKVWTI